MATPAMSFQSNPTLASELASRVKVDQDARFAWIKYINNKNADKSKKQMGEPEEIKKLKKIDAANLVWLKKVVDNHGWPGKTLVGKIGAHDAWLLVQHADEDKPFQKKCLKLMEAMLPNSDVDRSDYAYLVDRVLVGEGKKQIYGTQTKLIKGDCIPDPVEDEANLDKRRKEMGLMPMTEYLKMVKKMYVGDKK